VAPSGNQTANRENKLRPGALGETHLLDRFEALPDHLNVQPITGNADVMIQRLEVEADEMAC